MCVFCVCVCMWCMCVHVCACVSGLAFVEYVCARMCMCTCVCSANSYVFTPLRLLYISTATCRHCLTRYEPLCPLSAAVCLSYESEKEEERERKKERETERQRTWRERAIQTEGVLGMSVCVFVCVVCKLIRKYTYVQRRSLRLVMLFFGHSRRVRHFVRL